MIGDGEEGLEVADGAGMEPWGGDLGEEVVLSV